MTTAVTRELLVWLHEEGYTYLIAEDQAKNDWYVFKPVQWSHESFFAECLSSDFDDHMILSISEALNTFQIEDYLNHEIVLPD